MGFKETSENNKKEYLKTHYYNASYNDIKGVLFSFFKSRRAILVDVNDDYQEMLIKDFFDINIKVYTIDEKTCAVDFKVMGNILSSGKSLIKKAYDYLNNNLEYVGSGLKG